MSNGYPDWERGAVLQKPVCPTLTRFTRRTMKVLVIGSADANTLDLETRVITPGHGLGWPLATCGDPEEQLSDPETPWKMWPSPRTIFRTARWSRTHRPDFIVVGPDNPLALGIVDRFQEAGFPFGDRTKRRPASNPPRHSPRSSCNAMASPPPGRPPSPIPMPPVGSVTNSRDNAR